MSFSVCYPYEFTLLSNLVAPAPLSLLVCYPYEFTLLSNNNFNREYDSKFVTPMNLHCSQTADFVAICFPWFVTPMNLHCSQTVPGQCVHQTLFVTPMNLHCSQTITVSLLMILSLLPL